MIVVLFVEKQAEAEQNAPLCRSAIGEIVGGVAERLTKSPGAIWDAGTK